MLPVLQAILHHIAQCAIVHATGAMCQCEVWAFFFLITFHSQTVCLCLFPWGLGISRGFEMNCGVLLPSQQFAKFIIEACELDKRFCGIICEPGNDIFHFLSICLSI